MSKVQNTLMTRMAALLLCFTMLLGMFPVEIITTEAVVGNNESGEYKVGELSILSEGGKVDRDNEQALVAYFSDTVLKWVEADSSIGRVVDGWWVGVKMAAPADMTVKADFDGVNYRRCKSMAKDEWTEGTSFWEAQDSNKDDENTEMERYITFWCVVNEQYLNDALYKNSTVNYTWGFDWDKDGKYEQTVTVKIDPKSIQLEKDNATVYPTDKSQLGTVSTFSEGLEVNGEPDANFVKVTYNSPASLNWVKAEPSIYRFNDGWWSGIKVTAPEDLQNKADFDKVTYQRLDGDAWSAAKDFWMYKDSKDTDSVHFIGLWGLLNEEYLSKGDNSLDYVWRFDWNGDGVYEQIVVLAIDPAMITLNDENGVQVFPELGDVTTITGGTVSNNKTGDVTVSIADDIVSLNWSPKNPQIGRNDDGWWAGILITAPDNVVITEDDDVKYESISTSGKLVTDKSFYKNQDSAKDGSVHYMQLWMRLDRQIVADAIEAGENITAKWRFNWDKKGDCEQVVSFVIDPNKVELKRVDRTDFSFKETQDDKEIWMGEKSWQAQAECPSAPGKITYSIDENDTTADVTINAETGVVEFKSVGKVTVLATIAEDDVYNEKTISYSFNIVKKNSGGLKFEIEEPGEITFDPENNTYSNEAKDLDEVKDPEIVYSIIENKDLDGEDLAVNEEGGRVATIDPATGKLTILRSGIIKVQAVRAENGEYLEEKAEYTLKILKADQKNFDFTADVKDSIVYSTDPYDTFGVQGGQSANNQFSYEITAGDDVAELVEGNKVHTLKSGEFTLSVTKAGDDRYNAVTATKVITVELANQTTFKFDTEKPENVVYNENGNKFVNEAKGGESTADSITYKVTSGSDVALFENTQNPAELTILKAGTVTVSATKAGDECYAEKTVTYTLTVERADQDFEFANGSVVTEEYGITTYVNEVVQTKNDSMPDGLGHGNGAIRYYFADEDKAAAKDLNASIDEKSGVITIGDSDKKVGKLTVTASIEADDKYDGYESTYTLEIKYAELGDNEEWTIEPASNQHGWHNTDIKIVAPEGYTVSYYNELSTNDWEKSVPYSEEGITATEVAFKNASGGITDKINISDIKIDKTAPFGLDISYDISIWEGLFGFSDKETTVTLKAEDALSGIDYIEYSKNNGESFDKAELHNGEYSFSIAPDYRDSVVFKAYDKAGNCSQIYNDGKTVVLDSKVPDVTAEYEFVSGSSAVHNEVIYTTDKVNVTFKVDANNFDLSEKPVVTVNGTEKVLNWTSDNSGNTAPYTLEGDGDYELKVVFKDRLNREKIYEKEIRIDSKAPEIKSFAFVPGEVKDNLEGRAFYDCAQTLKIEIDEHNFDASKTNFVVTADNAEVDEKALANALTNGWTDDEDKRTHEIVFDKDANYTVQLTVYDYAGNATEYEKVEFTVDTKEPEIISITYDKPVITSIIEAITFGFYKAPIVVTVEAADDTAGVKEIHYSYIGTTGSNNNCDAVDVRGTLTANNGTAQFTIPEGTEFLGIVSAKAVDWSHKTGAEKNTAYDADGMELHKIVVDNKAPLGSVVTSTPARVVDAQTLKDITYSENENVFDRNGVICYYNGDAVLTVIIDEANFFENDVVVKVNGEKTIVNDWTFIEGNWQGTVKLDKEGDYTVTVDYTDKSDNTMETYTSPKIVIDKTAPEISVKYYNTDVKNDKYFDDKQTATITIKDHNFRADDVNIKVTAKDSADNNVFEDVNGDYVVSYYNDGCSRDKWTEYNDVANWRRDDDTYKYDITFDTEANYVFDIEYTDLAVNVDSSDNQKSFTVDKTAPESLNVEYSDTNNIFSNILYFKDETTVVVSAFDNVAKIDFFNISVNTEGLKEATTLDLPENLVVKADGTVTGKTGFISNIDTVNEDGLVKVTFKIPAQFNGRVIIDSVTDLSGNASDSLDNQKNIVVDNVSPEVKIAYSGNIIDKVIADEKGKDPNRASVENADGKTRFVYNGEITATITVDEANFDEEYFNVVVTRDDVAITDYTATEWTRAENSSVYTKILTLINDGDYRVKMSYTDKSTNDMNVDASNEYTGKTSIGTYESNIHTVDTTPPELDVSYDNNVLIKTIDGREYYDQNRTATITVTDRNFRPSDFEFKVSAKNAANKNVDEFTYPALNAWSDDWNRSGDTWTVTVPFDVDANYTVTIDYKDIADNSIKTKYEKQFTVDKEAPEELDIKYSSDFIDKILSTILYYDAKTTVTITAKDAVAGIECFAIDVIKSGLDSANNLTYPEKLVINADGTVKSGTKGFIGDITSVVNGGTVQLSFEVPAQFNGSFVIKSVTDNSHNKSVKYDDDKTVVVDTVSPDVTVKFSGKLVDAVDADVKGSDPTRATKKVYDADTRFVYSGGITATITVKEANFYDDMEITVIRDGKVVDDSVISDWKQINDSAKYVKTIKLSIDGDYRIKLSYMDKSDNKMDVDASGEYADKKTENAGTYVSNIHTIDTVAPVVTVTYNNNNVIQTIKGRDYFDKNRTATITVTDRNFRPGDVKLAVATKDSVGENVEEFTYSKLTSWSDWTRKGNTWTAKVPFDVDANYSVRLSYMDIADNKAESTYRATFTVDKTAPEDLKIEYVSNSVLEKIIETVTFRFYKAPVKVRISATDDTSGVYRFVYSYAKSKGVSDINAELINEAISNADIKYYGAKAVATFTIPKDSLTKDNQFRGNVKFTAYDKSENSTNKKDKTVTVVDSVSPVINVTYTAVDENTVVRYVGADKKDVNDFKSADKAYFNGDVIADIVINEANFFEGKKSEDEIIHEVGILLTATDNNGNVKKTEYLPDGAAQMFGDETKNTRNITWKNNGDEHTIQIKYASNADYVLEIVYKDYSNKKANIASDDSESVRESYTSKAIAIDKYNPTIKVEYSNDDVKNTADDRKYFDDKQTATITIKEHNFRAEDVDVSVIAQNVVGTDVIGSEIFKDYFKNNKNWTHMDSEGNVVKRAADGNIHVATYTFDKDANYTFDISYTDLAQRKAVNYVPDKFTVDKTAPDNLTVNYGDTKLWEEIIEDVSFGFYNAKVKVTITADDTTTPINSFVYSYINSEGVSEKNAQLLDEAISNADITYDGYTSSAVFYIPKLVLGNDNQFNGTVEFTAADMSDNSSDEKDDTRIVVDNIKPEGNVHFNEHTSQSEDGRISYYSGNIEGTIVINEANFYEESVTVSVERNGAPYPVTVNWTHDSVDVHTGRFTLTEDGDYFVTVTCEDKSENEMDTKVSNQLTIDKTAPSITVSNIKNNSANKDEVYGFTVTVVDTNINTNNVKVNLNAVVKGENGEYKDEPVSLGDMTIVNDTTCTYTVENLTEDAVYTLTGEATDMALNKLEKVLLEDNKEYEKVRFSINRNGSTFDIDENTVGVVDQYYIYNAENDVVIEEINVDPIEKYSVKVNGNVLEEGKDYTTVLENEDNKWSVRKYIINKSVFEKEGEYDVVVESTDKTDTTAFSDIKDIKIAFVVDRTAPVLTITGVEDNGRYQVETQTVTVLPTDDGGKLSSIKVILLDSKGKETDVLLELKDDELTKQLEENDGKLTFKIPQGLENQVRIVCADSAKNADGKANVYDNTFKKVTVSPSGWIIFYADKTLFYSSIAAVVLVVGGLTALIVLKKRKKNAAKSEK